MQHIYNRLRPLMNVQNGTVVIALLIALGWVWGTVTTLQKNFNYQRQVDQLSAEVELDKLRNQNLAFQQKYFQSSEFLELSAREKLGKVAPGEKVIILPDSRDVKDTVKPTETVLTGQAEVPSNFQQWVRFFFGRRD